ncbi:hypothetical protein ASD04_14905 [Devosia sp. Root436]|uniref:hypothetical protein n=1 Tax=Devosia sp. Root436 TaxID=1736537 RepID=UPI0006FB89D6|nr:hypothetical protein [Devosia sp. Root436]KQX35327.1 hypothetical protein ASD04_14905 [Devosia sp. Root436]
MPKLIATKGLRYATRRMMAGDEFEANNRDARVLVAIGKARPMRMPGSIDAPPPAIVEKAKQVAAKTSDDDKGALNKLRADYQTLVGKKPFAGWKAGELQRRIDEALAS